MAKVAEEREHAKQSGKRIRQVSLEKIPQEIETLPAADVWILNEVDWGVKRHNTGKSSVSSARA
jgi:hypothetical protein